MGLAASPIPLKVHLHDMPPATLTTGGAENGPIALADGVNLLWQDAHLALVHKPSGMLSVPGRGPDKQDCLSARLAHAGFPSLVVHRLDQATSGLMLFARNAEMQRQLSHAFAQRQVHKQYLARVAGHLPASDDWQMIDAPIAADWPRRPLQVVDHLAGPCAYPPKAAEISLTTSMGLRRMSSAP